MTTIEELSRDHGDTPVTPPEPQPALAPAPARSSSRSYIVLSVFAPERWAEVGVFEANSTDEAIRKAAASQLEAGTYESGSDATYVAVPSRSFQPVTLTAHVQPKIEFKPRG